MQSRLPHLCNNYSTPSNINTTNLANISITTNTFTWLWFLYLLPLTPTPRHPISPALLQFCMKFTVLRLAPCNVNTSNTSVILNLLFLDHNLCQIKDRGCTIFHFIAAAMHCGLFGKMVMLYVAAGKVCGAADVVALFHALTVGLCSWQSDV